MQTKYNHTKIWKHSLVLFYSICAFGQEPYVTRPENASILHAGEIPVNLYTGIPDVNIPIYKFPTHSKDIIVDLGLSYHPSGLSALDKVGSVGRGWNINDAGVITRSIVSRPDERFSAVDGIDDYDTMTDVYQYSFMGQSGRFMIKKNFTTGAFSIQMMDHSTMKIEYTFNSIDKRVNSFTIYDDKGYKYVFDVRDINFARFKSRGNITELMNYNSAHYLSKIYDNNGKILVSYAFDPFAIPYKVGSAIVGNKIYNRLNEITITDIGKASFSYMDTPLSPENPAGYNRTIKAITIKNSTGQTARKTVFSYAYETSGNLIKVSEFSADLSESRDHKIFYNTLGLPQRDSDNRYEYPQQGWLEKIVLPTGGSILYEFEWNTIALTTVSSTEAQNEEAYLFQNPDNTPVREIYGNGGGEYDTSVSRSMSFSVTGSAPKKLEFSFSNTPYSYPPDLDPTGGPLSMSYKIMSGSTIVHDFGIDPIEGSVTLVPGNYTISIITVSNLNTTGNIAIMHDVPNGTLKKWLYSAGLRIKRIASFDHDASVNYFYNPTGFPDTPAQETSYQYTMFDDAYKTSGYEYQGLVLSWDDPVKIVSQTTGYANVKVTKGSGNGYTKYTFAAPTEYASTFAAEHHESLRMGLLKKVEIFNSDGTMLTKTENTYDMVATGDSFPAFPVMESHNYISSKVSWAKLASMNVSEKLGNNLTLSTQTFTYNDLNKKIASQSQNTSVTGGTLRTVFYYHVGDSALSKNRISEIEKTEIYKNNSLISTSMTNFSNTWAGNVSWLPQTIQLSKGTNLALTKIRFNLYDEYGNPLEIQQENGMKTALIWGYNKTLIVAKIDNMAYSAIPTNLITAALDASNAVPYIEANLLLALKNLRGHTALSAAYITSYTHEMLNGVSTITDPKGDTVRYKYGSFGQLKAVYDNDGNLISENVIHYKN